MTKNTIKNIIMVVAVMLCLALAGGWIAQTVVNKKQKEPVYTAVEETDGMQVGLSNESKGVKLTSARIAATDYSEYGISAQAESAYTLNATVSPDDATDKTLNWALAFANPVSSWANGKTVMDYVTMNVSGTQATLECNKAFGEPIYVTATSKADSTKSASCRLDYRQKVTDISYSIGGLTFTPFNGGFMYADGKKLGDIRVYPVFDRNVTETASITLTKTDDYTLPADLSKVKLEMKATDNLKESLSSKGYTNAVVLDYTATAQDGLSSRFENFLDIGWAESIVGATLTESIRNTLYNDMKTMDIMTAYELSCYVGDLDTPIRTYNLHLDFARISEQVSITNVTFDKSGIEF